MPSFELVALLTMYWSTQVRCSALSGFSSTYLSDKLVGNTASACAAVAARNNAAVMIMIWRITPSRYIVTNNRAGQNGALVPAQRRLGAEFSGPCGAPKTPYSSSSFGGAGRSQTGGGARLPHPAPAAAKDHQEPQEKCHARDHARRSRQDHQRDLRRGQAPQCLSADCRTARRRRADEGRAETGRRVAAALRGV